MRVLALDLATTVGFHGDDADGQHRGGKVKLRAGGHDLGAAGLHFSEWLAARIKDTKPDVVAFEAPAMGGAGRGIVMNAATSRLLIGLAFMTEVVCKPFGVRCLEENVATVRKHLLGTGRPPDGKKAVMDFFRLLGWKIEDHNHGDAAALYAFTKAKMDPTFRIESTTPMFARTDAALTPFRHTP